ncbi:MULTISPECIES: hypothetical protein [Paenibacillus]|uniref:hypothetical protein n=1 Tax=Paenibacillus TaxID=44249 RepID=UPI0008FADFA0|nr:hypothetical protein [Paenibacillus polymyxa]APB75607.1 hypothetical protein PPYC2_11720 [Paenibacillus polymyxa]POR25560.1 hypothetical protein CG775_21825 [Paenibacillus polymyxa]
MTDKPRNWQEDMNGCAGLPPTPWTWVETDEAEWIEDSKQEIVIGSEFEYIFDDLLGPNVRKEAFMRFMINAPEALPYWLQQYDIELRGRIRWSEVAKGLGDDLEQQGKEMIRLQKVIQQKDAEIARLKKSIEGLQLITKIERSTRVQPEHTSFLRDKGDKL